MSYVKVVNGTVEKYPYSKRMLWQDFPQVSFPKVVSDQLLAEYGIFPVVSAPMPEPTNTQDPAEQTPQLINGVWTQVWVLVDVSPEEAARRQQDAADEADAAAVKADAFVQSFVSMTPAEVSAYVNANTANITQVRALLNKMALMLLALARREYR